MTWQDALPLVVAKTGHRRYEWLCSDDNPNDVQRTAYRAHVVRIATGQTKVEPKPDPDTMKLRKYLGRHGCCS